MSREDSKNLGKKLKSNEFSVPPSLSARMSKLDPEEYKNRSPDAKEWFDREHNRKQIKHGPDSVVWAAPRDPRYQQIKMGRFCFDYFVDYHRCLNLLGEDHKPCKFFYNSYKDVCPSHWIEQFNEWVDKGVFPADFNK